jgi:hypothetical protein
MKRIHFSRLPRLLAVFLIMLFSAGISTAQPCTLTNSIVINTGYDPTTGLAISIGSTDPSWIVNALSTAQAAIPGSVSVGSAPYAVTAHPAWASPGASSRYVSNIMANGYNTNTTSGRYTATIRRTFKTCIDDQLRFSMQIACDDTILSVRVDGGASLYTNTTGVWNGNPHVSANGTFTLPAGIHTIDVEVANLIATYTNNDNYFGIEVIGSVSSTTGQNSIATTVNCECIEPCGVLKGFGICTDPIAAPFDYTFTPNVSPASANYIIDFGDFTPAVSSTGNVPIPHTYTSSGTFTVTIFIIDNAGNICDVKTLQMCISVDGAKTAPGVGVVEEMKKLSIDPYPNPSNSELNIPVYGSAEQVKVSIVGREGSKLRELTVAVRENKVLRINTVDLAPGLYFIYIIDGHGQRMKSFVRH